MTIYLPPSLAGFLPKWRVFSTWVEHLPFAYDLVAEVRPQQIVELGTYRGLSFFCMCQSIVEHGIACTAHAVDTWEGDKHTDAYEEQIYEQVAAHAREFYPNHAVLMRMLFDDAVSAFQPQSIDLLHIDGLHTYDAVKHDFTTWYDKVTPGGIILFHDVCARIKDFGVWKFWGELQRDFKTFTFHQGFGLGVLLKPGGTGELSPLLQLMFDSSPQDQTALREIYSHCFESQSMRNWEAKFNPLPPLPTLQEQLEARTALRTPQPPYRRLLKKLQSSLTRNSRS